MKTKVQFAALVLLALTAMCTASCGGNATKKQAVDAADELEQQVMEALNVKNVSSKWENNEYTRQLPKPDIVVAAAGESDLGYSASFAAATLAQIKAYAAKVKEAGFDKEVWESDGDTYIYSADNADGWSVMVSWAEGQAGVLISKPE